MTLLRPVQEHCRLQNVPVVLIFCEFGMATSVRVSLMHTGRTLELCIYLACWLRASNEAGALYRRTPTYCRRGTLVCFLIFSRNVLTIVRSCGRQRRNSHHDEGTHTSPLTADYCYTHVSCTQYSTYNSSSPGFLMCSLLWSVLSIVDTSSHYDTKLLI